MTVRQFLFRDRNEAREAAMWTHGKGIAGREPQVQRPCGGSLLGTVKDKLAGVWLEPGEWDRVAAEDSSPSPRSQLGPCGHGTDEMHKMYTVGVNLCSLLTRSSQRETPADHSQPCATLSLLDNQMEVYVLSWA